jgi:carboxylesterase
VTIAALVLVGGVVLYNLAARAAVRWDGTSVPRDPDTGLMVGAGPTTIDRGRPRACLLLHGWLTSPADFSELTGAIDRTGWDVHAPLHVGHGTGPADMAEVDADDLLGGAREHYSRLREEYERVALLGFSMGGTIATILASERPPDRLVLVAPLYRVRHRWYYVLPARWWHVVASPFIRYAWRGHRLVHINQKENRDRVLLYTAFPISAVHALFELRRRAVEQVNPDALTMPVLLLYGTGDGVCSPAAMDEYLDEMASDRKQTVVYRRSDHHLLHDYDGEEATKAITEFLHASARR